MRRRSASPEADTMSYCPPPPFFIRLAISSEEPAYLALMTQCVWSVKGLAHESSTYPSHAIRFSWPSPAPTLSRGFIVAVGGWACVLPPLLLVVPHALSASAM